MAFLNLSVLTILVILCSGARSESTTILLVQSVSRHGDRAPTELYPNDPNGPTGKNCFPNGLAQLTQLGWQQMFDLGIFFRFLYGDFVPTDPEEIYMNSSGTNWCLDSAAALLNSLLPEGVKTPVHHLPKNQNKYLDYIVDCPMANDDFIEEAYIAEYIDDENMKDMLKNISKYSGLDCFKLNDASTLFASVYGEMIHNCTVPEWAYNYKDVIVQMFDQFIQTLFIPPEQIRLRVGPLLGLLNDNIRNKMFGKLDLKFILNVAHDAQIFGILKALNISEISYPPFCSTLLFELHQMTDFSTTIRLRYINTTYPLNQKEEQPVLLVLDGCSEFCPVEYFMEICNSFIPENWENECQKDK